MNLLSRIQWLWLITPLFILFISIIEPNECLVSDPNEVMITGSRTISIKDELITSEGDLMINSVKGKSMPMTVSNVCYEQNRDSLLGRINDTVSYPGGEAALQQFLFNNNIFNSSKLEYSIEGIVVLRLSIDSNGYVNNKNIVRSIGGDIDEEALRLADLLVFVPATDAYGEAIISEYILKVCFNAPIRNYKIDDSPSYMRIEPDDEFDELYNRNGPACFPGGKRMMRQYFRQNVVYPKAIIEQNKKGKVKLLIYIRDNGYISVVHVLQSPDVRLNEEAIRLVNSVTRWKAEIRNDKPISSFLTVDVKFKKPKRQ